MSDLISREAAIQAVNRYDYRGFTVEDVKIITDGCAEELRKLPSVEAAKMDVPTKATTPKKDNLSSHSERDIVLGCIALIDEVLNGEFAIFEQLEADGFDFEEYKEKSECELGYSLTYFEIVQRLLLYHTSHSGGTSTRAKCKELGFEPNQSVSFHRDRGDEEDDG